MPTLFNCVLILKENTVSNTSLPSQTVLVYWLGTPTLPLLAHSASYQAWGPRWRRYFTSYHASPTTFSRFHVYCTRVVGSFKMLYITFTLLLYDFCNLLYTFIVEPVSKTVTEHFLLQFSHFDSQSRLSCQMTINAKVFLSSAKTANFWRPKSLRSRSSGMRILLPPGLAMWFPKPC